MVDEMIVTQSPPEKKFDPITIVLETEAEAAIMWAALGADIQQAVLDTDEDIDISGLRAVECRMYSELDGVYNATVGRYAK